MRLKLSIAYTQKLVCVLAFALVLCLLLPLPLAQAKPKRHKRAKLWYYEHYMLNYNFKAYAKKRAFYALARVQNKDGVGAKGKFGKHYFYNGTIVQCIEPPDTNNMVDLDFYFLGSMPLHKSKLHFKASKKDKVNHVWGVVNEHTIATEFYCGSFNVAPHEPFHILGIDFQAQGKPCLAYIIETPTHLGLVPIEKVKVSGTKN